MQEREVYYNRKLMSKTLGRAGYLLGAKSKERICHKQLRSKGSPYSLPAPASEVAFSQQLSSCPCLGPRKPHHSGTLKDLLPQNFKVLHERIQTVTNS